MSKAVLDGIGSGVLSRTLAEGYGPGAWHGNDLKASIADVTPATAFRRPAAGRHNIAEIALHHAYCAHDVRGRLSGKTPEPFAVDGGDWVELNETSSPSWARVLEIVDAEQRELSAVVEAIGAGESSPLGESERFDLVLGITAHAVYHAGQIQLVKTLLAGK
jgi:hypothetical protein